MGAALARVAEKQIVILPGMDGTGKLCRRFVNCVRDKGKVLIASYPNDRCVQLVDLENQIIEILEQRSPCVLIAESFSGPIALRVAVRRPGAVSGVVLCGSFVSSPVPRSLRWFMWLVAGVAVRALGARSVVVRLLASEECPPDTVTEIREALESVPWRILAKRMRQMIRIDARSDLEALRIPILFIQGTKDRVVSLEAWRQVAAVKADVSRVLIEGPHLLLMCKPKAVYAAIEAFISSLNE